MNIFNLLTKEKHVAGVEIDDSMIRVAFFHDGKKKSFIPFLHTTPSQSSKQELTVIEETLPDNIVKEGVVVDQDRLGKILANVWTKAGLTTRYAIVAIPDDQIYLRIFSFPRSVDEGRLREAMTIGVSFQLPMAQEDVYLDWEHIPNSQSLMHEVLLSAIPKTVAEGYIGALTLAGIKPLALESHLASIARAVKTEENTTTIFTKKTNDDATIFVMKDQAIRFSRAVPVRFVPKTKFEGEVKKIQAAFESELAPASPPIAIRDIESASIRDEYAALPSLSKPSSKWLVALGAAIRGIIPEGDDHFISLLPIKMEEAYAYQKAATFAVLIRNMILGVSVFFIAVFLSMYFFMLSLSESVNTTLASQATIPISSELLDKETTVRDVNALTLTTETILSGTPVWSTFLEEIDKRIIRGIIISNLVVSSTEGVITLNGTAQDRTTLNEFKKTLQESPMFSDITLPITNLEQKEGITFNVSFRLKDVKALYYK